MPPAINWTQTLNDTTSCLVSCAHPYFSSAIEKNGQELMSCEHKQLANQRTFEVSTDYIYCPSRGSKSNANTYLTLDLLP